MSVFRENWLETDAGHYVRFGPVPEGTRAPILAEVRRDGDAWVPRVMPDHEPICDPAPLVRCMDAVEERLAELKLVRAIRDLCADAVSGCRYDDDDLPDAGDDVRSLDPADLLARVPAHREVAERQPSRAAPCWTCGGNPDSHPSGLKCICEDGTHESEVANLRRAAQATSHVLGAT